MNILVTGSKGVVGTKLIKKLRASFPSVFGCDISHSELEHGGTIQEDTTYNYARCDIANFREITSVCRTFRPDLVYHTAAEFGRWNGEDFYEKVWRTNAVGTKNLLRLQEQGYFKGLVHFSSSEVYGDYPFMMNEDVLDTNPIKQMNDYALSKWVNEVQIHNSPKKKDCIIVRLFNTYGPGEYYSPYRSVICRFCYCAIKNLPIRVFVGHTRCNTYIDDAIDALVNIPIKPLKHLVYNIGSSVNVKIEDIAYLIKKIANSESFIELQPAEAQTTKDKLVNNSRAVQDLNFKDDVNLEAGLTRTIAWMRGIYG